VAVIPLRTVDPVGRWTSYLTAAEPDHDALAHAPRDVQEAFSRWK
jgi:hypothetical protein